MPDWEATADSWALTLLPAAASDDAYTQRLLENLRLVGGEPFVSRFTSPSQRPDATAPLRLRHPDVGELRLLEEVLDTPDDELQLVVLLPADDQTTAALDRLSGRQPGVLRAVAPDG